MSGRLRAMLMAGCILASCPVVSATGHAQGTEPVAPPLMQLAENDQRPTEGASAPETGADQPAGVMPMPAPLPVQMQRGEGSPRSMMEVPGAIEIPAFDASLLLWIVIALLAIVGLTMALMSRMKSTAQSAFHIDPMPAAARSKIDAALEAALSAQSGPARIQAEATVEAMPALSKAAMRVDRPLVIPDGKPRFGKRG